MSRLHNKTSKERVFSSPKRTFIRLYYIIKYDNIQCENHRILGCMSYILLGLMHIASDSKKINKYSKQRIYVLYKNYTKEVFFCYVHRFMYKKIAISFSHTSYLTSFIKII